MKPILAISILVAAASSLVATEQDDPPTNEKSASLPAPVGKEKFTFQQIEQQKDQLKDKIVLVEITLVGKGGDIGNGMLRYFAEDTSGSAMPYGRVDFPRDALNKLGYSIIQRKGRSPSMRAFTFFPRNRPPQFAWRSGRTSR